MTAPVVLRGAAEIGAHLNMPVDDVDYLLGLGLLPVFMADETPCSTVDTLDNWRTEIRAKLAAEA